MSVRVKTAIADYLENHISGLSDGDVLFEANVLRESHGVVDNGAGKWIRLQIESGAMTLADVPHKEMGVEIILQCFKRPESESVTAIDAAIDTSFEMARAIYELLEGSDLDGEVCDVLFPSDLEQGNYRSGTANFEGRCGATYLYGVVNSV